ncbi:transglutaminase [Brevundimonas sp. Leaf363]|uniref:transglutaminase family protein n=1 Tax=Brevundimonas sp. Leaf363 TaxID=1736353 RepID=UPI0006FAE8F1|nr:transglutaminase family protein [Brevundimonas sp. Leaf363]KQS53699.1 transglutaminase [Brevundimonas sp. Leaf363]
MRIRIDHSTRYAYQRQARFIVQTLRLTPRSNEGQQVMDWRIETDVDAHLRRSEDAFGNVVHTLYTERPTAELTIRVTGEVATSDTNGVVYGTVEKLATPVFLRETPLTAPDAALRDLADRMRGASSTLAQMHQLSAHINEAVVFDTAATSAAHTAAEAYAMKRGVCQDHAQIFIATARRLGVPARYVSGHLHRSDGQIDQEASHAWAEAYVPDLGWVGFDPANGVCPTEHYVRVAVGLDALGASPIRGTSYGGGPETLTVALRVRPAPQGQQQQQGRAWS